MGSLGSEGTRASPDAQSSDGERDVQRNNGGSNFSHLSRV